MDIVCKAELMKQGNIILSLPGVHTDALSVFEQVPCSKEWIATEDNAENEAVIGTSKQADNFCVKTQGIPCTRNTGKDRFCKAEKKP